MILLCQRAQADELEKIRKHYELSEEEDVKLLDKPEQLVFILSIVWGYNSFPEIKLVKRSYIL